MSDTKCPSCLNGCGGVRSDCPKRAETPQTYGQPGRPSKFTPELARTICERLIDGESMVQICASPNMPHRSTVLRWQSADPSFAAECARAREMQADYMDHKILTTAEDCTPANWQVAKVQISAYQWRAEKLNPKRYGARITQELTGKDGGPIVSTALVTEDPIEAAKQYQRLMGE